MNLVERAKNILVTPKTEWEVIKNEQTTTADLFTKYAMILALIPVIATIIGFSLVGVSYGFGIAFKWPISSSIFHGVLSYVLGLAAVYAVAAAVDALAPSFGSTKNMDASLKVVVYSYTAFYIAGIFMIFPLLSWLALLVGLYSFYLMYLGLKIVKDTPQDKVAGYLIVTIIIAIVIYIVIGLIVNAIAAPSIGLDGLKNFDFGN
jgi:hypothetical protein